jgi:hypothetical protein
VGVYFWYERVRRKMVGMRVDDDEQPARRSERRIMDMRRTTIRAW